MEETLQIAEEMTEQTPEETVEETTEQAEETPALQETEEQEAPQEDAQPPLYTQEQLQEQLDRLAVRERERGKRQAEQQYGPYMQLANLVGQAAGIDASDPNQLTETLRKMFEENGVEIKDEPPGALPQKEQTILGEADAREDIALGIDYVLERLNRYEQAPPQDFREIKRAQELAGFASQFFAAQALEKQGVKAQEVLNDKNFQQFAARYRDDVPITDIYADYKKMNGEQPKPPKSTGSIKGQGRTDETYFTLEQAKAMSRKEIAKHYDAVERSRRNWFK